MTRFAAIAVSALGLSLGALTYAQTAAAPLEFVAVSVKPAQPGARGYSIQPQPGRLLATNVTLKQLVAEAYRVYDFQVFGGPKWMDTERFDLEGKAGDDKRPTHAELRTMLQGALAQRFNMSARHEGRDLPVFVIDVGKGGIKFKESKDLVTPPLFRVFQRHVITAERAPLEYLTDALSQLLGRPVLDKTGLKGIFDFKLEWAPDEFQVASAEAAPKGDANVPAFAGALQEQMGLRIQGQKTAVDVVVVDRAEKPTAN